MPPNSARNKEREAAPHLASNSRGSQPINVNASSRRTDGRDVTKKKVGEAGEDWRRGTQTFFLTLPLFSLLNLF